MNAKGHLVTGATVGALSIVLLNKGNGLETKFEDVAIGLFFGGLAGLVPDLLEPATNPHHRGMCHSIVIAGLVIWATWKLHSNPNLSIDQKKFLSIIAGGYLSHLAVDGLTPMGLPIIGKEALKALAFQI